VLLSRSLAPFRHAWPLLKRQRRPLLLGLVCLLPARAIDLAIPLLWRVGIDGAVNASRGADGALPWWPTEVEIAGLALALGLGSALLGYATRRVLVSSSRDLERDLRLTLHRKLLSLPSSWFARQTVGDLASRLTQDVEAVRMALGPAVMYVANALVALAGSFALMLWLDPALALWMGVPFVVLGLVALLIAPRIGRANDAVQVGIGRVSSGATECFSAIRVLKVFTGEERQEARMGVLSRDYFDAQMRLASARGGMMAALFLVKDSAQFVILLVGGLHLVLRMHAAHGDGATTGSLGSLYAYRSWLMQSFWPLVTLGWIVSMVQRASAGMRRIAAVLETEAAIASPASPNPNPNPAPTTTADGRRAALSIEWRDVSLRLGGRVVLDHVSLFVPAGASLGITGRTGSGKTLLVQLVARLLDPDEGAVLVGGVDVREWELDALRRAVGFVPQESFLFSESLRENLRFARPDAGDAAVLAAVHASGLDPDLAALPKGLDTRVGERGVTLSGGQRQRATLARTLLADPPVVVLDDALSAVDAETEARILVRLRGELAGRTALVVSHRVAALHALDRVAVVEAGRVVEFGTHAELVRAKGRYATLDRDQRLLQELEAL
jgi:ATP-binding cassette subfamily B protein